MLDGVKGDGYMSFELRNPISCLIYHPFFPFHELSVKSSLLWIFVLTSCVPATCTYVQCCTIELATLILNPL